MPGSPPKSTVDPGDAPPPVGSLSGTVAAALVEDSSCEATFTPAVYVFEAGTAPSEAAEETVATGAVTQDSTTSVYGYSIADLVAGTYSAAFTCNGTAFVPDTGKEAVIKIGEDTSLDF